MAQRSFSGFVTTIGCLKRGRSKRRMRFRSRGKSILVWCEICGRDSHPALSRTQQRSAITSHGSMKPEYKDWNESVLKEVAERLIVFLGEGVPTIESTDKKPDFEALEL